MKKQTTEEERILKAKVDASVKMFKEAMLNLEKARDLLIKAEATTYQLCKKNLEN